VNGPIDTSMSYLAGTGWVDRPDQLAPAVAGEVDCDVAVIGGGAGGLSAALRLAQLGVDVALVESDLCGWGASGRNAGYLSNTMGSDPRILARFYADRVRGLMRFANTSVAFTEELIRQQDIECHYQQTGVFTAATTARQLRAMKKAVRPGARTQVVTSREAGIPDAFLGGLHARVGGILNPGEFSLGLRAAALAAGVRIFEGSPVGRVDDHGTGVTVHTPGGRVRAGRALLTTNAFTPDLAIAPRRLATPVRVTAVETEPVSVEQLHEAGWTSGTPIVTSHLVMESYRPTNRGTIVFTTRQLQMPPGPIGDRQPDQSVVADLVRAFRQRFPTLGDIRPARTWGGWIAMTPSNLPVAGQASSRVLYSLACNGHGLPQAPYLGHLLAEHLTTGEMHEDLQAVWRTKARFAPGIVNPATLKLAWMADRITDRLDR